MRGKRSLSGAKQQSAGRPAALVSLVLGVVVGLSLLTAGCAAGGRGLADLPAGAGGESDALPPPPRVAYDYPAVHDMPPARATKVLSDAEKVRMEKELEAARDRQERAYGKPADKPAGGKPQPGDAGSGADAAGAKPNP